MEKKAASWWDKLGVPQYGDEMVIRINRDVVNFDPYFTEGLTGIYGAWLERLVADDWTVNPEEWDYQIAWHPAKYQKGNLAESYEFPDPTTHIVHLRKGVHWQNIPPAKGREFTSDDVLFHYHRIYGLGGGFLQASPYRATDIRFQDLLSIHAPDKYTVVFKFKTPNPDFIMETLHNVSLAQCLENPDVVKKYGDMRDWHHAIGTGPYILKEFVAGKYASLVKNPDYWAFDERHPQNKLPYADKLKLLIMLDENEAIEAMRQGKIDVMNQISFKGAQAIAKTNPEIIQIATPGSPTVSIQPRNDKPPYNDIRVRMALQMAIDLPAIAKKHYNGSVEPYPSTLTATKYMKGWGFPYEDWPQELKDEYAYNPARAKQLLTEAGYPNGFKTNVIADTDGDMELLQIVKSYFADIGIDMEVRVMKTPDWVNYVEIEKKHDQLIYRPYGPLGHTYAPLRAITRFQTGYSANHMMVADPVFDSFYPKALAATNEDELKKVLRDANERVARQHYAVSLLLPLQYSLCQPWLKGFNAQVHSIWMGSGGPSMLSFYSARFWIDRTLKKSMGH
jgi:peptide/nickel transport system substrate-binding protein